jgi:hypothetical protein
MEFASQASFLEKMRHEGEIIWTYFSRHPKTHRWSVKAHARKAFFEFMSGWSIYVRDPRRYGWRLGLPDIPRPTIFRHKIEMTWQQREFLITANSDNGQSRMFGDKDLNTIQRAKQGQAAKGFIYVNAEGKKREVERVVSLKPAFVADLIAKELAGGHQVIVWTEFDAEIDLLMEAIGHLPTSRRPADDAVAIVRGATKKLDRPAIIERFLAGTCRLLISRSDMLGYGQNLQCCDSMIFDGWSDSFEDFYQAVRRAFRYGQTESVRVHLPVVPELEGQTLDNIERKQDQFERDIAQMEANYIEAFGRTGVALGERGAA